jgi:hypothetical protein
MSGYMVVMIKWWMMEPIHPGHMSREDAERLRQAQSPQRLCAITTRVWDAYEAQLADENDDDD